MLEFKNDLKINFRNIKMRGNIENICPTYAKLLDIGSHLGATSLNLSRCSELVVATCFSEPLGGTPMDRCWPPLRHPWSDFLDFGRF